MSENCTHDCSSCGEECPSRQNPESFLAPMNKMSNVKKVIGVVSGKGGVGKSLVTSMLAVTMQRRGFKTAILDADITGPSIPKCFGIHEKAMGSDDGLFIKQFWSDVIWNEVDYMFVDLPPGTGDAPLTVFQSIPLDGIIIVTSPQELVSMIVSKAVEMAKMMNVPVLGLIENYSYVKCPCCGEPFKVYGESHIDEVAAKYDLKVLDKLPLDPQIASLCDRGAIEFMGDGLLDNAADAVEAAHRA